MRTKNRFSILFLLSLVLGINAFCYGGPDAGLVAHYPFDSDADDKSGNGNNGTIHGAKFVEGKFGLGLEFADSAGTYVEVPHSDSLAPAHAVTVSVWAKVYSYPTWHSSLVYKAGQEPTSSGHKDRSYTVWATIDQGVHSTSTPAGADSQIYCDASGPLYGLDDFAHIVSVFDTASKTIVVYVNGTRVQTCWFDADEIRGGSYPLRIGGPFKTLGDQSGLNGVLDDVRIYNRALSEQEIYQLYTAAVPQAGRVDVSDGIHIPETVQIDAPFEISFKLKEHQGGYRTFETIAAAILDGDGGHIYDAKTWGNVVFDPHQERYFTLATSLDPDRPEGEYQAIVRGKLAGDDWFDFGVVPGSGAVNPQWFDATAAPLERIHYVALGDSFSSGEGAVEGSVKYFVGTDTKDNKCHRSPYAYSTTKNRALERVYDIPVHREFFACSGATTENVHVDGHGQYTEPGSQIEQIEGLILSGTSPDLITITIGGNDVFFGIVVAICTIEQECRDFDPSDDDVDRTLEELFLTDWFPVVENRVVLTIKEIQRSLEAMGLDAQAVRIVLLGYPQLFPQEEDAQDCVSGLKGPAPGIGGDEQDFLREMTEEMNRRLKNAADRTNIDFVPVIGEDAYGDFAGHELCGRDGSWINGLKIRKSVESFHPNVLGQRAYADALEGYLRDWPDGRRSAVIGAKTASPALRATSAFADADAALEPQSLRLGDLLVEAEQVPLCAVGGVVIAGQGVRVQGSGFAAGAEVTIGLVVGEGEALVLGSTSADGAGDIDAEFALPADAEPQDLAWIQASGTGDSGVAQILIGWVEIVASASDDGDGDGILDICDNCPALASPDQADSDADGLGNPCDPCPFDAGNDVDGDGLCSDQDPCPLDRDNDADGDGLCADVDNCPSLHNPDQADGDRDGVGDLCDNCPDVANWRQDDADQDGVGDACDRCPGEPDDQCVRTLTVTLGGTGLGSVESDIAGIDCGDDCQEDYPLDTAVTLTATPEAGHSFAGWGGACSGTLATCELTMATARDVTATFTVPDGPCPAQTTLRDQPDRSAREALLTQVRDRLMAASPDGRWMVEAYYRHAGEVSARLASDAGLRRQALGLLYRLREDLAQMARGVTPELAPGDRAAIRAFAVKLQRGASTGLEEDLSRFLALDWSEPRNDRAKNGE
jgi:lysophospholipase L1-like esterase